MKKLVCLLFCAVMLLSVLTACKTEHKHTFDTKWQYDSENHWKQATCEHTDVVSEKAAHLDDDENDLCDVCGAAMEHEHTYQTTWTQGEKTHYYKPTCGCADESKYRKDEADHDDKDNDGLCDVCKYDYGHKHTYATEWTATEDGHWHAPTCGHDVDGKDKTAHVDADNDGICDDCNDSGDHEHSYAQEWTSDENEHWHAPSCGHDVEGSEKGAHEDADNDGKCDVCEFTPEHFHVFAEGWTADKTGHWHAAACEHAEQINGFAAHTGYEEDGVCDVCAYNVMFTVSFDMPDYVNVVDKDNQALTGPFLVKEGEELVVYLAVPDFAKLELVEGADYEAQGTQLGDVYLYKVIVTPTANTTVTAAVNKLVACEVVVDGAKITFEAAKMGYLYQVVKFNAPAAGRYAVYCLESGEVRFADGNATQNSAELMESSPYLHEYIFDVAAAGEVALKAQFFAWDAGTTELKYYVVKLEEEMVLPYLSGSGYTMPTNAPLKVTFTLPEVGMYHITSTWDVEWNGSLEDCVINCTTPGQKVELTVRLQSDQYVTFNFDWDIIKLDPIKELVVGNTQITATPGRFVPLSFTAPSTGTYVIKADHKELIVHYWGTYGGAEYHMLSAGQTYEVAMEAGQVIRVYIKINEYSQEEITTDITSNINVEFLGYVPAGNGSYSVVPNLSATFINSGEAGDFTVTVGAGAQISFDGGKTWTSEQTLMTLSAGQRIYYMVKNTDGSSNAVSVSITRNYYQFTLNVGENTQTLIPGKEYAVSLDGGVLDQDSYTADYVLSWTDSNIKVTMGGITLTSPATLEEYSYYTSRLYVTYNGSAAAEIKFTLVDKNADANPPVEDPEPPAVTENILVIGNNDVVVTNPSLGTSTTFTAPSDGTYIFSFAAGETNGDVGMELSTGFELVQLPKKVELKKDEKLALNVTTLNHQVDTISILVAKEGEEPDFSAMLPQLNGRYEVNFMKDKLYELTFTPDSEGATTGKLVLVDNDEDSVALGGTYTYSFVQTAGVTVMKADGTAADIIIGMDADGKLTVKCGSLTDPQILVVHQHVYLVKYNSNTHWEECYCGEWINDTAHVDADQDTICDAEGCEAHCHVYTLKHNANTHWDQCACGHWKNDTAHIWDDDYKCLVCGYQHVHTYTLKYNANTHWLACACGFWKDDEPHTDADKDTNCDKEGCGAHCHVYVMKTDDDYHWNECACGSVIDKAPHVDDDQNAICDVCQKAVDHIHTFDESKYVYDDNTHWYAATCAHTNVKKGEAPHTLDSSYKCACGYQHQHTYETGWSDGGEKGHYHKVTCGHTEVTVYENHSGDYPCAVCGSTYHVCSYPTDKEGMTKDAGYHWLQCNICGSEKEGSREAHSGHEVDGKCDVCDYVVFHVYTVTVTLPTDPAGVILVSSDGTTINASQFFNNKEGDPFTIYVSIRDDYNITAVSAGTLGEPSHADGRLIYPVTIASLKADTTISFTTEKLSKYLGVSASDTLASVPSLGDVNGTLTLQIPQAGTYIVLANAENRLANLRIGSADATDAANLTNAYVLVANAAGAYTVSYFGVGGYMDMNDVMVSVTAVLQLTETLELPFLTGTGYELPAHSDIKLKVTLDKAGVYCFATSNKQVRWYVGDDTEGKKQMMIYEATQDGEVLELTINNASQGYETVFNFDWSIEKLEPKAELIVGGSGTLVNIPALGYYGVKFVAPTASTYQFSLSNSTAQFYSFSEGAMVAQGNTLRQSMEAAQEVIFFIRADGTAIDDVTALVTDLGYLPTGTPGADSGTTLYKAKPNVQNSLIDLTAGDYVISVPAGYKISFTRGTWVQSMELTVNAGDIVSFQVKTDDGSAVDSVQVTVAKKKYEAQIGMGENVLSLLPGKTYTVTFKDDLGLKADEIVYLYLSWTQSNVSVKHHYEGYWGAESETITSGNEFGYLMGEYLEITYKAEGTEAVDITFTFSTTAPTDPGSGETPTTGPVVGVNTYTWSDNSEMFGGDYAVTFTATEAGTYKFETTNGVIISTSPLTTAAFGESVIEGVVLAAGETFTFYTKDIEWVDDFDLIITKTA